MTMRGGKRISLRAFFAGAAALALVLVPATAASSATSASAGLDDFSFESMDVVYHLARDDEGHATLDVVETMVAIFPEFDQNRGYYRDIPDYYGDAEHGWVHLETNALGVTDENGDAVPYWTEYYEDFYSIALGDDRYVHGRQTYVIHYTQRNTSRSFPATETTPAVDEFYWDVNGTGWSQSFGRVSVELRVDPELVPELFGSYACYSGFYADAGECPSGVAVTEDPETGEMVYRASATDLDAFENLTIAVGFQPATFESGEAVTPPSQAYDDEYWGPSAPRTPVWLSLLMSMLTPLAIIIGFVAIVSRGTSQWVKHRATDIVIPQYEAPEAHLQLASRLAGQPNRAFAAQVVDLAVRGKLRILDDPDDNKDDFVLELVDDDGLTGFDRELVEALFATDRTPGKRFSLTAQTQSFTKGYEAIRKRAESRLVLDDWMTTERRTSGARFLMVAGGATAALAWILNLYATIVHDDGTGFIPAIAATWGGWQAVTKAAKTRDLTAKGADLNNYLLGMKDYLELAEADRFRVLQSVTGAERTRVDPNDPIALVKLYEQLLPWAVMWGIERSWGEVLIAEAAKAAVPLTWMSTPQQLTQWRMFEAMSSITRVTPTPPAPARTSYSGGSGWSSSGSSSFSSGSFGGGGGGFSGGGGGGGGGRGR